MLRNNSHNNRPKLVQNHLRGSNSENPVEGEVVDAEFEEVKDKK